METSVTGSLAVAIRELEELALALRRRGDTHYLGVAMLNLAYIRTGMNRAAIGLGIADEAIGLLASTSGGMELVSARLARAQALAVLGDIDSSRKEMDLVLNSSAPGQSLEVAVEIGQIETLFGEAARAWPLLERVASDIVPNTDHGEQALLTRILLHAHTHELASARTDLKELLFAEPRSALAFEARRYLSKGLVLALDRDPDANDVIRRGTAIAQAQEAHLWGQYGRLLGALADAGRNPSPTVLQIALEAPVAISMAAELVLQRLKDMSEEASAVIFEEAESRPWRWRASTRVLLVSNSPDDKKSAGRLLEAIGELEDVRRLREAARSMRDRRASRFGYQLARRLADRVLVEDLGRLRVQVGERVVDGSEVRRKVLALLCLLVSKPRFTATRDEVIDSLWPDHDPSSALNSLNQTVYFLRRVFELDYADETSPGYVGQDGETIWLDSELIDSRSRRCLELIRAMPGPPTPEGAVSLASEYRGRFALDFAYEDWTSSYRDALHAGYLRVMEHAVRIDLDTGHFGRGTFLAERASEVDPEAEEIQVALIRLYRHSGAHAAAAEQYGHYAQTMRDLGVEPIAFADV
jgi:DNA-binding SARP family transcriptional activator